MAELYIANPTLQNHDLQIRLGTGPTSQLRRIVIPAGQQRKFPDNLDGEMLGSVIRQLENLGAVEQNNTKGINARYSLEYEVAKPVTAKRIDEGRERDEDVRQELGSQKIEESAVAAFDGAKQVGAREVTMEIVQRDDLQDRVTGGVDAEITVGTKKRVSGGRASSRKE